MPFPSSLNLRIVLTVLSDTILVLGVLFHGWDIAKIIAFFYFEICDTFIAFIASMYVLKRVYAPGAAFIGMLFSL